MGFPPRHTLLLLLLFLCAPGCARVELLRTGPLAEMPQVEGLQQPEERPDELTPPGKLGVVWLLGGRLEPVSADELAELQQGAIGIELSGVPPAHLSDKTLEEQRIEVVAYLWNNELDGLLVLHEPAPAGPEDASPSLLQSIDWLTPELHPLTPTYDPVTPGFTSLFDHYHSFTDEVLTDARTRDRETAGYAGIFLGGGIGAIVGSAIVFASGTDSIGAQIGIPIGTTVAGALAALPVGYWWDYIFVLPGAVLLDGFEAIGFALGDMGHLLGRVLIDAIVYPGVVILDFMQYTGAALYDGLRAVGAALADGLSWPWWGLLGNWQRLELTTAAIVVTPAELQLVAQGGWQATSEAIDSSSAAELLRQARTSNLQALGIMLGRRSPPRTGE